MSSRSRTKAFTTLELLIVIGIIVTLAAILMVSLRAIVTGTKERTTKTMLGNAKALLAELESANALRTSPPQWAWWNDGGTAIQAKGVATVASASGGQITTDFWKTPYVVGGYPDAMVAPAMVDTSRDTSAATAAERAGAPAIVNTMLAMSAIASVPANRTRIQGLPNNQTAISEWVNAATQNLPAPGADKLIGTTDDPSAGAPFIYVPGVHVQYQRHFYVATVAYTSNTQPTPNGTTPWYDETASPNNAPIILDGWNNPIIYVPSSGLRVRMKNGKDDYLSNDATQNFIVISPEGKVTGNLSAAATVEAVGRPFWASAGPDGDFSKGDDNIYSFEN